MSTEVLVTVVGATRRGDVCLDNTVPIATLLPDLGRHYGLPAQYRDVVLADDAGVALNPETSLEQAGVTHGSRLVLRPREVEAGPVAVCSRSRNPLDKTRDVLPERYGAIDRLQRSFSAATGRTEPSRLPVAPASATTPRRRPAWWTSRPRRTRDRSGSPLATRPPCVPARTGGRQRSPRSPVPPAPARRAWP